MHHLEAGLVHRGIVGHDVARAEHQGGLEERAAQRVLVHVELDCPHAELGELLGQRAVAVLEAGVRRGQCRPASAAPTFGYSSSL